MFFVLFLCSFAVYYKYLSKGKEYEMRKGNRKGKCRDKTMEGVHIYQQRKFKTSSFQFVTLEKILKINKKQINNFVRY